MELNEVDKHWLGEARKLAERGRWTCSPNPMVGAIILNGETPVGSGFHMRRGEPHAEVLALRAAGAHSSGATLYVTLEPCAHFGKTPPCADAIIRAGIKRVVSALDDPNPEVAGQGHERLRAKGIAVDVGLCAEEARHDHAGHIARISQGRPHVTLKLAISADGKVGLAGRKPVQITGEAARERVFMMRAQSDAILVGIGTVLADNPQLTCRLPGLAERSPVRVVLDARLSVPLSLSVVSTVRETPTWVFCSTKASPVAEDILQQKGCKVFRVEENNGKLDLAAVLKTLAGEGITRLMVEGGPTVAASFLSADLVDEAVLLRGEKTIGDDGIDPLQGMALTALTDALALRGSEKVGADTLETYERK